jgi:hypothetical protein
MPRGTCPFCMRIVPGRVVREADGVRFVRLNKHRYVTRATDSRGREVLSDHGWCGGTEQETVVPHVDDYARFYAQAGG